MPLVPLHHYLLLTLSGFVLLMQTAIKTHYHQPGSYHDAESSLHAPMSSLALEKAGFFAETTQNYSLVVKFSCFAAILTLIPICMNLTAWHDPSPSRAPPSG